MKNNTKSFSKKLIMATLLTGVVVSSGAGITHSETVSAVSENQKEQVTKYPKKVMETVRLSLGVDKHSTSVDSQINSMPKVQVMDRYLESFGEKLKGKEVRKAVMDVFKIDLDTISEKNYGSKLSTYQPAIMEALRQSLKVAPDSTELDDTIMNMSKAEVMDRYINFYDFSLTGAENRVLINQIFGVNLDGISGLEHAKLSIHSKGQWIVQSETDLFYIYSSDDDVSLTVGKTDFNKTQSGTVELPESLKQKLINLGFTYDSSTGVATFSNPTGESVPDALKGQIIKAIITTIMTEYTNS